MGKNLCASSSQPNMVSPTSSFKPTLNDQDYMELVCENGKILAKSQKINNNGYFQNQRKQSILDLYETEYDESFKKNMKNLEETQVVPMSDEQTNNKKRTKSSKNELERDLLKGNKRFEAPTLNDYSLKGLKKVEVITAPPDEQSEAVGRSTKLYFTPSSMLSRGTSRDLSCSLKKRKCGDNEEEDEETTCLSNSSDDESDDAKTRFPTRTRKTMAKRKRSTEVHRLSERKRRHEISKKMRALQDLLPNYYKDDKVSLLDEAIKYTKTLQLQVQMMSMRNGLIQPSMMLPMCNYSPMGLGMHMGAAAATPTSLPEFMPMSVHGTCFRGNNMLNAFLNHPTGLVPNSPIFSPLESCSQQMVMPSCFPETQATSFSQFPKSDSTSNFENAMQFRGSSGY